MSATPKHHERHVRQLHKRQQQTPPTTTPPQKKHKLTSNAVHTLHQRTVTPPRQQAAHTSSDNDLLDLTTVDDPDQQIYQPLPASTHLPSPYALPSTTPGDNKQWLQSLLSSLISKTLPSSSMVQSTIESKLNHRTLLLDNKSENARTQTVTGTATDSSDKLTTGRQCITPGQQRGIEDIKYSKQRKQLKLLSSRQKKALKLVQLPSKTLYTAYMQVHELWQQYMHDILTQASLDGQQPTTPAKQNKHNQSNQQTPSTSLSTPANTTPRSKSNGRPQQLKLDRLLTCDYTGCLMTVTQSVNPSNVGVTGIVVQETMHALKMVTKTNSIKTILKRGSVFEFSVRNLTHDNTPRMFELYGSSICMRSSDRSVRKFKFKPTVQEVL